MSGFRIIPNGFCVPDANAGSAALAILEPYTVGLKRPQHVTAPKRGKGHGTKFDSKGASKAAQNVSNEPRAPPLKPRARSSADAAKELRELDTGNAPFRVIPGGGIRKSMLEAQEAASSTRNFGNDTEWSRFPPPAEWDQAIVAMRVNDIVEPAVAVLYDATRFANDAMYYTSELLRAGIQDSSMDPTLSPDERTAQLDIFTDINNTGNAGLRLFSTAAHFAASGGLRSRGTAKIKLEDYPILLRGSHKMKSCGGFPKPELTMCNDSKARSWIITEVAAELERNTRSQVIGRLPQLVAEVGKSCGEGSREEARAIQNNHLLAPLEKFLKVNELLPETKRWRVVPEIDRTETRSFRFSENLLVRLLWRAVPAIHGCFDTQIQDAKRSGMFDNILDLVKADSEGDDGDSDDDDSVPATDLPTDSSEDDRILTRNGYGGDFLDIKKLILVYPGRFTKTIFVSPRYWLPAAKRAASTVTQVRQVLTGTIVTDTVNLSAVCFDRCASDKLDIDVNVELKEPHRLIEVGHCDLAGETRLAQKFVGGNNYKHPISPSETYLELGLDPPGPSTREPGPGDVAPQSGALFGRKPVQQDRIRTVAEVEDAKKKLKRGVAIDPGERNPICLVGADFETKDLFLWSIKRGAFNQPSIRFKQYLKTRDVPEHIRQAHSKLQKWKRMPAEERPSYGERKEVEDMVRQFNRSDKGFQKVRFDLECSKRAIVDRVVDRVCRVLGLPANVKLTAQEDIEKYFIVFGLATGFSTSGGYLKILRHVLKKVSLIECVFFLWVQLTVDHQVRPMGIRPFGLREFMSSQICPTDWDWLKLVGKRVAQCIGCGKFFDHDSAGAQCQLEETYAILTNGIRPRIFTQPEDYGLIDLKEGGELEKICTNLKRLAKLLRSSEMTSSSFVNLAQDVSRVAKDIPKLLDDVVGVSRMVEGADLRQQPQ